MESPFAALPAAVIALDTPDGSAAAGEWSTPLHYGDPLREQRALEQGRAVVDAGDRSVISVSGPERLTWLDSITSQQVTGLAAGDSSELLVLDPNGRIEHSAAIFDDGETAWLIADADDAPGLQTWLARMVFRAQVKVQLRPDLHVIGFEAGALADDVIAEYAAAPAGVLLIWRDPWTSVSYGGHQYAETDAHPGADRPWAEAILEEDAVARLAASQRAEVAGVLAAEARRVAAWRPRWSAEVDERSIPHELDWLRSSVHLNKGCYRGQETVAKVHNLGHPPRRLVLLHLDGTPAAAGDAVYAGEQEVGAVTSAAYHYELGPIALALLKRSVAVDAVLTVKTVHGDVAASQELIVPPSAGAAASVPRLPRLGARR